jgi:hypothetical protein
MDRLYFFVVSYITHGYRTTSNTNKNTVRSCKLISPMKYLSADLLLKAFHGLICVIYLSYTYINYIQPKQAVLFSPVITA